MTRMGSSGRCRWHLINVVIVPLQVQNAAVLEQALAIEKSLTEAGLEVLTDDRDQRPGVKFKDADLIGIPLRVVIGETRAQGRHGGAEVANRARGQADTRGVGRRVDSG